MQNLHSPIEPLEPRIAPAAVFTYTDADGDAVTIKSSKGTDDQLASAATFALTGHLQGLNLSKATWGEEFAGTSISFTVKRSESGDGKAHLGFLNAIGIDLATVKIKGDLAQIQAGDSSSATPAIKTLSVSSMGRFGFDTVAFADFSFIKGAILKLTVAGDFALDLISLSGGTNGVDGNLGVLTVGGSFTGGVTTTGDIGSVVVKGAVSGSITAHGELFSVTIGGSLVHEVRGYTGRIVGDKGIGSIKIGGDVVGGPGEFSGYIESNAGSISSVTIRGSLIGAVASNTGTIFANKELGPIKIGGSIIGGSMVPGDNRILVNSGSIYCQGPIASVTVGGSMIAGSNGNSAVGGIRLSACITAGADIGSVKVAGSIIGNPAAYVSITAPGQVTAGPTQDLAIGKITVGGSVEYMQFIAGYSFYPDGQQSMLNGDASIGAVKIGGSWTASYLSAGINSVNGRFADGDDVVIAAHNTPLISRIASITIGGEVVGTPSYVNALDCFGFAAEQIGSFKAAGVIGTLTSDTDDPIFLSLPTGDVALREVAG